MGSAARFVRRSCRANTTLRHVVEDGRLHIVLVAAEDLDYSDEVTIPFDRDFTRCLPPPSVGVITPVQCACRAPEDDDEACPVRRFNRELAEARAAAAAEEEAAHKRSPPIVAIPPNYGNNTSARRFLYMCFFFVWVSEKESDN